MRARSTTLLGGTVSLLVCVAAVQACDRDPKVPEAVERGPQAAAATTPAAYISTRFEDCAQPASLANPAPRNGDTTRFANTLHGVWVGSRTVRDGKSLNPHLVQGAEPNANYVIIYDMNAREGFAFEERGPTIRQNAFTALLPQPAARAPRLVYFYCGTQPFAPFRDEFVKVSSNPSDGLRALAQVTGMQLDQNSVFGAWRALRDAGYFTRDRGSTHINSAFYTISLVPVERRGSATREVRWDMVGQYRGSPAKFTRGQPVPGMEGGFFEAVAAAPSTGGASGNVLNQENNEEYMVSDGEENGIICFCDLTQVDERGTPLTNMKYTKIVLGPLQ